ncbi:MAG: ribose 5-phosphate isomerase B [Acetobacteraceae bacterium]
MRVVVGSDHAGWSLKSTAVQHIHSLGHQVIDVGSYDDKPVDFPDIAQELAKRILSREADRGIMLCGTGVGAAIAANKIKGIRAAVCHDCHSAHQAVEHDDVNVLCIGGKIVGSWLAQDLVSTYLAATFSTDEDCRRRVRKLDAMEAASRLRGTHSERSSNESADAEDQDRA